MQKIFLTIVFICSFTLVSSAQVYHTEVVGKSPKMSPFLFGAFRKPVKPNPLLSEYIKPSAHELMYWPNFPLNASQISAKSREWPACKQSIGEQIAGDIARDIIKNQINSLIYGKKMPVAVTPKF